MARLPEPIQIPLPMGMTYPTVNAYLFPGSEPTLVDCGLNTPKSEWALAAALRENGLGFGDLKKVVVTHPHVDHVGLAGALAEAGAEVWMSDLAWDWMADLDANRSNLTAFLVEMMAQHGFEARSQKRLAGYYDNLGPMYAPLPPESVRVFRAGDQLEFGGRAWQVVYAPGHSNRQVCFFHPESGRLLSADMLLPKTPSPVVELTLDGGPHREKGLPQLLESYTAFRALDISRVYPGHGDLFNDHRALIDRQLARIEQRKRQCLALVRAGCETLPALLKKMYAHMPAGARLVGLAMLIGYLDLLESDRAVSVIKVENRRKVAVLEA